MPKNKFKSNNEIDHDVDDERSSSTSSLSNSNDKDSHLEDHLEGAYDPNKFDCPDAPSHVRNLFQFIGHYSPQMIEIGPRLKPFIPDYIPTVGHVDAFIKIPYPDGRTNDLGLTVLDEPNIEQSDATLLQMKLKALSREKVQTTATKTTTKGDDHDDNGNDSANLIAVTADPVVPMIQPNQSNITKEINKWIDYVKQLHETTARPESVALIHQLSDHENIESLMQEWPEELETTLNVHTIPTPELDCSIDEYMAILMAILDIPVQNNKITSLYQLFTLLNEFQNSQHFNKYDNDDDDDDQQN
ncbi:intraflagellar transport protein 46-like protein [Dermatophagoides farinae]|uniref:Intraflagellar transport protein 46 homolog n=1 Tax=Dermatophagoides farinae TaxID=6954 RepID=A0A9D4P1M5_DERFA|nr:intraflagellar transport protein 46-like protein [Dermatophagoides farinae]